MAKDNVKKDVVEEQIDDAARQIGYTVNEFTVGYLGDEMEKLLNKNLGGEQSNFSIPDYQREFIWAQEPERVARFIESVVMGLPIPFIFFYESPKTGQLEIIDGTQRMRSIHKFIYDKEYKLSSLERLTELNGKGFVDLSESRKRKIRNRTIRGIALDNHADERARRDLFDRINTGSRKAEPAEVRRGSLEGTFMDLIIRLSNEPYFVALTPFNRKKEITREREELVTRFFAYSDGLEEYHANPKKFLAKYVKKMNEQFAKDKTLAKKYETRFKQTMDYVAHAFPLGFRVTETGRKIPRVRFESIAIGTWWAIRATCDEKKLQRDRINEWINCAEYQRILRSDAANNKKTLTDRIEFVQKCLMGEQNGFAG
jgi:hypothetical protein